MNCTIENLVYMGNVAAEEDYDRTLRGEIGAVWECLEEDDRESEASLSGENPLDNETLVESIWESPDIKSDWASATVYRRRYLNETRGLFCGVAVAGLLFAMLGWAILLSCASAFYGS